MIRGLHLAIIGVYFNQIPIKSPLNHHFVGWIPLPMKKTPSKCSCHPGTDRLVTGGFKFRRSAFRGNEPKVWGRVFTIGLVTDDQQNWIHQKKTARKQQQNFSNVGVHHSEIAELTTSGDLASNVCGFLCNGQQGGYIYKNGLNCTQEPEGCSQTM